MSAGEGVSATTSFLGSSRPKFLKSSRPEPLAYTKRTVIRLVVAVNVVFLYLPLLTLVIFSFNDSKRNIVWRGFTLKYYERALENEQLVEAFANTLVVALIATAVATVLGTALGIGLHRFRFPAKGLYDAWAHLPIMIPEVCMGVALLVFFALIDLPLSLVTVTISHITFCLPFVAVVVRARAATLDPSYEEAAYDLGASRTETLWFVTLPQLVPGIVAGALLAMTVSLDDFVITFFTGGPGSTTFPVQVYSMIKFSMTPEVNAASTVLIALTVMIIVTALVVMSRGAKEEGR